jgi:hypothetical protein
MKSILASPKRSDATYPEAGVTMVVVTPPPSQTLLPPPPSQTLPESEAAVKQLIAQQDEVMELL